MLWNLECPVGLNQKEKYVRISMKEILAQFGRSAEKIKNKRNCARYWGFFFNNYVANKETVLLFLTLL